MILPIVVRSGLNAEDLLETAEGEPEGYDLVADQERPLPVGQLSRRSEVFGGTFEDPRPRYRLQKYRRHPVAFFLHRCLELATSLKSTMRTSLRTPSGMAARYGSESSGRDMGTCSHMPS